MPKLALTNITSGYLTQDIYNANNAAIIAAMDLALFRDGQSPNTMSADIDMNSRALNNCGDINAQASTVNALSIILNGTVLTAGTTLSGGADASAIGFTPTNPVGPLTTVQDALDDDYVRNDRAETITGALTLTNAAGITVNAASAQLRLEESGAGVDQGNWIMYALSEQFIGSVWDDAYANFANFIEVARSGTGASVAVDSVTIPTDLIVTGTLTQSSFPAEETNHRRAGHTQVWTGNTTTTSLDIDASVATDTWESIGPTGSGADNVWAQLDVIPAEATVLMVDAYVEVTPNSVGQAGINVYVADGDVVTPVHSDSANLVIDHVFDIDLAGGQLAQLVRLMIPLGPTNQDFQMRWTSFGVTTENITFFYRGFMTD